MRIKINGELREVKSHLLGKILIECGYQQTHFATALNGKFVHKHLREEIEVMPDDRIEVVAPNAGG